MADSLVGKLGEQIKSQISGFTSGMKSAFVGANPALLGPALSGIEKAFKGQSAAMRREQEQKIAERGFVEENANEQRKLFTDILGEQKETNDYLKKILEALLGKNQEEPWWKKILAPLLALAKLLKDNLGKLISALGRMLDLLKGLKFADLFKNLKLRLGNLLGDIAKFFRSLPGKFTGWLSDLAKFFGGLPKKFAGWFDDLVGLLKAIPGKIGGWIDNLLKTLAGIFPETTKALKKLFSDLADILKLDNIKAFFNKSIARIGDAFAELVDNIRKSNLFKAFGSLIDDLKALPAEISSRIRGAIRAVQESDLVKFISQLFDNVKLFFARIPSLVSSSVSSLADAIKGSDFVKGVSTLGDTVQGKFASLANAVDARFTAITDVIKGSAIGKAATTVADDLAGVARSFVTDLRGKLPTALPNIPDAPKIDPQILAKYQEAISKQGFERTAIDRNAIRAYEQATDVARQVPPVQAVGAGGDVARAVGAVEDSTSILSKLQNLIPPGLMSTIDSIGNALGKVFGFLKNVGTSIADSASGIGRFLASVTDLDVMMNVIGKFVKALPVIGWIFTTIDGLQAAFDTAGLAETLGKKAEDVTLADRLKGFVGGFFGSFFGIIDFFEKMITGQEGTLQKDMTAAIIKLTDEIAGSLMEFFKFWGNILTSEPMMAIYKFVGQLAGVAFELVGNYLKSFIELIVGVLTFNPEKVMGGLKNLYDSFLNAFADTFSVIGNFLKTPIAILANVITDMFESAINFFVDGMNWMMSKLQSIPGVGRLFSGVSFERVSLGRMDETTGTAPTVGAPTTTVSPPRPVPQAESQAVTLSRPSAPPVVAPQPGAGGVPLSVRNNNPGNLKFAGQAGVIGVDSKGFAIFESPEAGMNAMMRQLNLDTQTRQKTLSQFVSKYAPASENDTQNYINFLSSRVGVGPNERIPPEKLPELRRAMIQMEGGTAASQYYYGGAGGPGGQPPKLTTAPQGPSGKPNDPVSIETVLSDEEKQRQIEADAREQENLRLLQEGRTAADNQEAAEQARHLAILDQMKRQEDIVKKQIDDENIRFQRERDNLYRQFNQTARNIYATGIRSAIGNLGVTGQQAFMMGGSSVVDKYLGDSFKKLGEKLFGKQQGGGMGFIFQKLLGSYANQAVNQILAPALGISAPLMNRALNNLAAGNKKEAYADIVFGMTGVPVDVRTFLEATTGRVGVENAINAFSQGLADISTGPMSDLFQLAPDGMGMYKVDLQNPNQDPTVLASQIASNNIHASSQLFGQNVLLAGKTMAEIGVLGAQTEAQIAETAAKNAARNIQMASPGGTQGGNLFSAIGDFFSETFGFKKPSGTIPGGGGDWVQTSSGMMVSRADLGLPTGGTTPSAFTNLMGTAGNFLGFAGGQAIGRGLGINTNTLGGAFAQAGVNSLSSSFMNTLFTAGPGAAIAGLQNVGTALMAGKFNPTSMLGSGVTKLGTSFGSQALTDFGGGMSGSAFGGGSSFSQMFGGGSSFSTASTAAQAGAVLGAIGNAALAYSLQSMLSGGYKSNAGKAVAVIGSYFDPTGGFIAGTVGAAVNRLFGRKAPEIIASGITGTLGADSNLQTFNDVFEKGGKYRSDKRYTTYSAADEEFVKGVEKAIGETTGLVEKSAKALSLDELTFKNFTKEVRVDLKGLTPEQQKKAVSDMIVGYTEDMLTSVYPEIGKYRRDIEGKLETNVEAFQRLANSTIAADTAFRMLGYTAEEITDVLGIAISDTATKLAAADVKQQMVDAFGGDQKMAATLQNYLGKVYSPEKLEAIKLSMAKATMADIVKENAPLQTVLDITKYNSIDDARAAHLAAFDAAMKASDFATANTLASSYDAFIEGVRLHLREKARTAQPDTQADAVSTYIDPALATVYAGLAEDQAIAMTPVAATPIVQPVAGAVATVTTGTDVTAAASGTTGAYLTEQYNAGQGGQGAVTNNTTAIDNSTVIATRPTSITVMRDDSVRDYHPILGASNRGLSGGYGWGNDYQGSFGAG